MKVVIVGTGHVGLVTAASLASVGHDVVGVDEDQEKVTQLRAGESPFYEPGLQELTDAAVGRGRLRFDTDAAAHLAGAEVVFICVGTPARATGEANLVAVERAGREIVRHVDGSVVVVEKSTVPAGTAERLLRALRLERPDLGERVDVVSNPEFLREGQAVEDALRPHRILVGARTPRGFEVMRRLYAPFVEGGARLIETSIETAELAKHSCNAFLALKISYANALARVCERAGADVTAIAEVMGSDPRIGPEFLGAGLGYGGYCFPKDLQAFERLAARLGYDFPLLHEVARINDEAVDATVHAIRDLVWNLEGKRIALLGLAFKPQTDDVRFSPSLALAQRLIEAGAEVVGYDPQAGANAKAEVPSIGIAPDAYLAAEDAHCLVIATAWREFRELDLGRVRDVMRQPVVVDARNLLDQDEMRSMGFSYRGIGRASRDVVPG